MEQKKVYRDTEQTSRRGGLIKRSILKHRIFFQELHHNTYHYCNYSRHTKI